MLVINLLPQIMDRGKVINRHRTQLDPLGFRGQDALRGGGLVLGAMVVPGEVEAHVDVCVCVEGREGGRGGLANRQEASFRRGI